MLKKYQTNIQLPEGIEGIHWKAAKQTHRVVRRAVRLLREAGGIMAGKGDHVLVLEEYDKAFSVSLIGRQGTLYSRNHFDETPDVAKVRSLVATLTHIFDNFNRVVYSKNFTIVWDHEARSDSFGKFMAELFASKEDVGSPENTKYHMWDHFSEFLEEQEELAHRDHTKDLPF